MSIWKSTEEVKEKLEQLFLTICKDDTPMVRWAAASAFGDFADSIGNLTQEMVDIFKKLLSDA